MSIPTTSRHDPVAGPDVAEARTYVAALERTDLPLAEWQWEGRNRARIRTQVEGDQVVSVQVNYHPGLARYHQRKSGSGLPRWVEADLPAAELQRTVCRGAKLRRRVGVSALLGAERCGALGCRSLDLTAASLILRRLDLRRRDLFLP